MSTVFPVFNILASADQIEGISFAVSITVIALLTITYGVLFFIYYKLYAKCVNGSLEDDYLKREVVYEHKRYFKKTEPVVNDHDLQESDKREGTITLGEHVEQHKRTRNGLKFLSNSILVVTYLIFVALMASAIYVRRSGDIFTIGGQGYLIIETSSMETVSTSNTAVVEAGLDDQIEALSLINIVSLEDESDVSLFDIVAFHDSDGNIIVHRIVSITQDNDTGETLYTCRGDANTGSALYEVGLTFDDLLGKYGGFQNFGLGVFIYYMKSPIGLITLAFTLVLVGFYDLMDIFLGRRIAQRKMVMVGIIDNEIDKAISDDDEIHYLDWISNKKRKKSFKPKEEEKKVEEPVAEEPAPVVEGPAPAPEVLVVAEAAEKKEYPRTSFLDKMANIDDNLKQKYNELKAHLLSWDLKSRISKSGDTFRKSYKMYARITVSGKSLKLYLALDPKSYEGTTYPVQDVSAKKAFAEIPCMIKVKSDLSLNRAKKLVDDMFIDSGITPWEVIEHDHWSDLFANPIEDEEPEAVEEDVEEVVEEPVVAPEPVVVPVPEEAAPVVYQRTSFLDKMAGIDDDLKAKYNELKDYLLSWDLKSRISKSGDSFRKSYKMYARIAVSGKALKLYLALDPAAYADSPIPVKDVSAKKVFAEIPAMIKVKSDLSLNRAKKLIDDMFVDSGITPWEIVPEDHCSALFAGDEPIEDDEEVVDEESPATEAPAPVEPEIVPEEPESAPEEEAPAEAAAEGYKRLSFSDRLDNASESQIEQYNAIKQAFYEYGLKGRYSASGESFRKHGKRYGKLCFTQKGLRLYLSLDPASFADSPIPVKDCSSNKSVSDVPCSIKIRSPLSLKRALQMIEQALAEDDLPKKEVKPVDHYAEILATLEEKSKS